MIKHTCKDCIHFKVCNDYVPLIGREDKVACPDYKSIEDVVPRSEYERLQGQVNRLKAYDEERDIALHQRLVREAKKEVADKIVNIIADLMWQAESEKLNILIGGVYCNKQEFIDKIKKYVGE